MDGERFDDLLRLWHDGEASAAEVEELGVLLRQDPLRRRAFVTSIRVELDLRRTLASAREEPARSRRWEAAAAALVLALSAFLLGSLFLARPEPGTSALPALPPKFRLPEWNTLTLERAIELAVEAGGGVPVAAELEEEEGDIAYSVALAVGTRTRDIELDLETGAVLEDEVQSGDRTALVAALKVPLAAAVGKALKAVPGRAMEAEAKLEGGGVVVEVRILAGGALRKILVDGDSGQILRR